MTALALRYLEFDLSDDADQCCTLEAMSSVRLEHLTGLLDEIGRVLDWLQAGFGAPGPLDEGADWDLSLDASQDTVQPLTAAWRGGPVELARGGDREVTRTTVTLALALRAEPAAALRQAIGLQDTGRHGRAGTHTAL